MAYNRELKPRSARLRQRGTTLIELLTVIVVFLVGILALIQIFPTGLAVLRTTRGNSVATALGRAKMQQLQSRADQMPELIAPVAYGAGGTVITIAPGRSFTQLMPDGNELDSAGDVFDSGAPLGNWRKISGANLVSRVIGEGRPIPAPRATGLGFVGLIDLTFGPMHYMRDAGTGVGTPGLVQVYGSDYAGQPGSVDGDFPAAADPASPGTFYTVAAAQATDPAKTPYASQDQLWIAAPQDGGGVITRGFRVALTMQHDDGSGPQHRDVIVSADPTILPVTTMQAVGNWWVINIAELIGQPGIYGTPAYAPAGYVSFYSDSVRVQNLFEELPLATPFDPADPYEYKVYGENLGHIAFNPAAATVRVASPNGGRTALRARVDYSVLDWRILTDSFEVPGGENPSVTLSVPSLKVRNEAGPDGLLNPGLELGTPDGAMNVGSQSFVLLDKETGGVVLGDTPTGAQSSYLVEYRRGIVRFEDQDAGTPGLQGWLSVPDTAGWGAPVLIDLEGRELVAHFMAKNEFAVQTHKAADSYRVVGAVPAGGLRAGECYVGGLNGGPGSATRVYFPLSDLGHHIVFGELWANFGGDLRVLRDQEQHITGIETIAGENLAYADLTQTTGGNPLSLNPNGFAVRRVSGSSVKVRVLWNPEFFTLSPDLTENYRELEKWMRSTRRIQPQSFFMGDLN